VGSSAVTKIGGSGGGGSKITINQANSFSAGDVVRYDSSTAVYTKALATTTEFAEAIGVIETATSANFVLVLGGKIDTSQFSVVNEDGTTETKAGDVYFLSATTEGKLTQTAPTTTGTIRKAMLTQTTADGIGYVTNYIGIQNGIGATDLVDISEVQPVGTIAPFAGDVDSVPNGFLLCNGQAFSSGDFPELATLLGSKYGAIEGDLHRVPDLRGKFALGNNPTGDTGNPAFTRRVEGAEGGSETHVLTVNEMPGHNHDASYKAFLDDAVPDSAGNEGGSIYADATAYTAANSPQIYDAVPNPTTTDMGDAIDDVSVIAFGTQGPIISNDWITHGLQASDFDYILADQSVNVESRGDNLPHNNIPPFLSVNFIIKASPNANAAILTTGIKNLSDVDVSRGGIAGTDNVRNGDILVYNTNSQNFVVAPRVENENFIRNGECRLWQRGTTFLEGTDSILGYSSIPNSKFTADGFFYRNTGGSAFKVIRGSENAVIPLTIATAGMDFIPARKNFDNDPLKQNATETLEIQRTYVSAFTPLASESHTIETFVEGYDFARLIGCDYMTLSFYAYSAATDFNTGGRTIGVSFRNKANSRSYVTSFTPSVGAWAKHEIKVPLADIFTNADIGNWKFDSTLGLSITFALSAGTSFRVASGFENTWVSGNFIAPQTQFDLTNASNTTNTTSLGLALLKLEAGAYATKFTCLPWVDAVAKSRRYFQKSYELYETVGTVHNDSTYGIIMDDPIISNTAHTGIQLPQQMRGTPTFKIFSPVTGAVDKFAMIHGQGAPGDRNVSIIDGTSTHIRRIVVSASLPSDDRRRNTFHYTADAELINPDSQTNANVTRT